MWVDLGVAVGLRSGRGLILPARGDFAQGGVRFLSRRGGGAGCGLISGLPWVWVCLSWGCRGFGVSVGLPWVLGEHSEEEEENKNEEREKRNKEREKKIKKILF